MPKPAQNMRIIKENMIGLWVSGDYGVIAKSLEKEAQDFISRLNIKPQDTLLDVACGSGNLAIPAARAGATVKGVDIVPGYLRQASERAAEGNLHAVFEVGDAEELPCANNEFDYVVSMFGAMFAPRPDVTANELLRVCKPGGTIAMANWIPDGSVGEFFNLTGSYAAPPPELTSPLLWGDESVVKERFGNGISRLKCTRRILHEIHPFPPPEVADHYIKYFGPVKVLFENLDSVKREEFRSEFIKFWTEHNVSSDGSTDFEAEYLEVTAVKAQRSNL